VNIRKTRSNTRITDTEQHSQHGQDDARQRGQDATDDGPADAASPAALRPGHRAGPGRFGSVRLPRRNRPTAARGIARLPPLPSSSHPVSSLPSRRLAHLHSLRGARECPARDGETPAGCDSMLDKDTGRMEICSYIVVASVYVRDRGSHNTQFAGRRRTARKSSVAHSELPLSRFVWLA